MDGVPCESDSLVSSTGAVVALKGRRDAVNGKVTDLFAVDKTEDTSDKLSSKDDENQDDVLWREEECVCVSVCKCECVCV